MPKTENQILKQGGRAYPWPSGQYQSISTRQAIQNSARIERSRLAKDLLDAIRDYGEDSPRVATILIDLAEACGKLENYQKQKEYVKKAVEVNRRNYGDNHLETAKAHHKLGNAYFNLKEAGKAKEEYEKALKINQGLKPSGQAINIEFAELCNNLGSVCHALKQYQEAEVYFNKALPVFKKIEGAESFRVATALGNLGRVYRDLNNHEESLKSFNEALPIYKEIYGDSHIEIGKIFNQLGNIYYGLAKEETRNDQKKEYLEQACQDHENAVTIWKKFYGNDDIAVAVVLNSLADDYRFLGNEEKAKKLYKEELEIRQKYLDIKIKNNPDSIETAEEFNDLSNVYRDLKDFEGAIENYKKAVEFYKKVLAIQERDLGPNDPITRKTSEILNKMHSSLIEQLNRTLEEKERNYSSNNTTANHLQLGQALRELADAYGDLKDYKKAVEFYKKALAIQEKHYGPNDSIVKQTSEVLNKMLSKLTPQLCKTLNEKERNYSSNNTTANHLQLGQALRELANAYGGLKDYKKAVEFYKKALAIQKKHYGPNDSIVKQTSEVLNKMLSSLIEQLNRTLEEKEENYSSNRTFPNHLQLGQALRGLADAYGDLKDYKNQKIYLERALPVTKETLGDSNTTFTRMLKNLAVAKAALGASEQEVQQLHQEASVVRDKDIQIALKVKNQRIKQSQKAFHISDTLFHYARIGDFKGIKNLVEKGVNVNEQDTRGYTPLHIAMEGNFVKHIEIIDYLLERGADPNLKNEEGNTPVHVAAEHGNVKSLESLLEHGGDPNISNKAGFSPLVRAVETNRHSKAVILLRNGAKVSDLVNLKYVGGIENLDSYAKENGYNDIITMLAPLMKQVSKPKPPVRAVLPMPQETSPSRTSSSQIVQDSDSKAQVPHSQFAQASVSEAQAYSSSIAKSPSTKKDCILM